MMSVQERRQWAMFVHLAGFAYYLLPVAGGVIGPLVMWQMRKGDDFVDGQGREAVNFQLSIIALEVITIVLAMLLTIVFIGPFVGVIGLLFLQAFRVIIMIVAALKANDGVPFRYPLTIRFLS